MMESVKPVSSTFEAITKRLDPAYSYMIFEKSAESSLESEFHEVEEILIRLNLYIHSKDYAVDDTRKKILLVVRFDPARADEILEEFMKEGLPKDVVLYAYGSHVAD